MHDKIIPNESDASEYPYSPCTSSVSSITQSRVLLSLLPDCVPFQSFLPVQSRHALLCSHACYSPHPQTGSLFKALPTQRRHLHCLSTLNHQRSIRLLTTIPTIPTQVPHSQEPSQPPPFLLSHISTPPPSFLLSFI